MILHLGIFRMESLDSCCFRKLPWLCYRPLAAARELGSEAIAKGEFRHANVEIGFSLMPGCKTRWLAAAGFRCIEFLMLVFITRNFNLTALVQYAVCDYEYMMLNAETLHMSLLSGMIDRLRLDAAFFG